MITKFNLFESNKTILQLKEEKQKKDEKKYLSEKERKRLTDNQRKYLVKKRKELGSWNDADLQKESLIDKMSPISKEEIDKKLEQLRPTQMLYQACKLGLLDYVKKAIKNGADTYNTFYEEDTSEDFYQSYSALDVAMENKHHDIVEYLLNNECESQFKDELNEYILHIIKNNNIKIIKERYKLEFLGDIGGYDNPFAMTAHTGKIFVSLDKGARSEILTIAPEDGKILNSFSLNGKVECLTYVPEQDFLLFNFLNNPHLYRLDLKTHRIALFSQEDDHAIARVSLKAMQDKVFALDHLNHCLNTYDLKGSLQNTISFQKRFEFPIQFYSLPHTNQILLTRYGNDLYQTRPGLVMEYGDVDAEPGTNFGIYSPDSDTIEYLPPIAVDFATYLWNIAVDSQGNIFLNNTSTLFKLDRDLKPVFSGKLHRLIPGKYKSHCQFYPSFIIEDVLYILETRLYRKIFKFAIL